jgi:hypothetical protein
MKRLVMVISFILLVIFGIFLVDHAYINLDHLGKGKLNSVTIECLHAPSCTVTKEPVRITDITEMKKLESVFYMKVTSNLLGFTKEGLPWKITFNYDEASVDFNVGIDTAKQTGYYKYEAKDHDYHFTKADVEYLSKFIH